MSFLLCTQLLTTAFIHAQQKDMATYTRFRDGPNPARSGNYACRPLCAFWLNAVSCAQPVVAVAPLCMPHYTRGTTYSTKPLWKPPESKHVGNYPLHFLLWWSHFLCQVFSDPIASRNHQGNNVRRSSNAKDVALPSRNMHTFQDFFTRNRTRESWKYSGIELKPFRVCQCVFLFFDFIPTLLL